MKVKFNDVNLQRFADDVYRQLEKMPKQGESIRVTNYKEKPDINANTVTVGELADAFGTLIRILKDTGIIK